MKRGVISIAAALAMAALAVTAEAKTFRFAFQGDLNALDPYALNETFTLGTIGNAMEGLVTRDKDLKIVPALAERWEIVEPTRWRFHLRKGVKFHNGEDFTADDVLFSLERALSPESNIRTRFAAKLKAEKVDAHTVDFVLAVPNPILHAEWDSWFMISKSWAEANGALKVQTKSNQLSPFALKANGTGPFIVESHEPGVKTIFKPNPNWWGKPEHNLTQVVFQTIKSDATRVAALLSGEVDMIDPVPVQDIPRVQASANTIVLTGPELRTIFLNMDQARDELLYSDVKGKNPFKDTRVRKAFYQAIDIDAIQKRIMRGHATPTALLIYPPLFSRSAEFKRHPYDPATAKKLLAEAGYPNGFALEMDCPNDRYVNDEAICQAVVAMLARIGIKAKLNAMPKARYFDKVGAPQKYDSSFNLLGWTASSLDGLNILRSVAGCRDADGKGATANFGGYCNPVVDELAGAIAVENDVQKRDLMLAKAFHHIHDEVGMIPLHQQALSWGVSKKVSMVQRADNRILFYWVRMQ
ncbi:MAG: ABC transporter substrate-binding protein [Hyphomicrobium sp.]|nr:ABC transporter substrate-binding protein [Hyphomicrobium sp.]MBN9276265.1 ABC transporter substrate-binding protein [Hyphomicrobium sp.]